MLEGLPRVTYTVKHHCVEGWTAIGTWTGVPVSSVARWCSPLRGALSPLRQLRPELLQRLGPGQRDPSADDPGVRLERPAADDESRCAPPALFPDQAGVQAHEVSHRHDLYPRAAGGLLGGSGISLVCRGVGGRRAAGQRGSGAAGSDESPGKTIRRCPFRATSYLNHYHLAAR